ncbi:uncharacterized protein LOC121430782 [Lytechinus variegatus]|uniref:uncharacterized protein LOC121430782 n=1 Tax=Lytechinus variegatus TaxID=7654 RepID=UPI001BB1855D|nr:uncharacterized protein LOC121430782 [Lytechinus variegatus]
MSAFLRKELTYHEIREYFWTDSKIVLGYINNESRRFHVYVANLVQQIRNVSDPASWYYVSTNPADDASRGLTTHNKLRQAGYWVIGGSSVVSSIITKCVTCKRLRGPVRQIRSYRGTAFVGAKNELRDALKQMDQDKIQQYLVENNIDWIPFVMNPPHASHMGGVWERQIQTVRRALEPLMMSAGKQLDDEAFRTFLSEAESIVNSRPLTTQNLSSSNAQEPLTPNHLLTMKSKVVLPLPGKFQKADMYARKWWRRVQHLTNEFWTRWMKEYLTDLQTRKKWARPRKSLKVGDIVISKEADDNRAQWPLGRVSKVYPSNDGLVRKVQLVMGDSSLDSQGKRQKQPTTLERPLHKLMLLLSPEETLETSDIEDQGIPQQGASTTQ